MSEAVPSPSSEPPTPGWLARAIDRCASPWVPALAVLLATILALPALGFSFFSDDYFLFHRIVDGHWSDVYTFATGVPAETLAYVRQGPYGWWSDPELKFQFFRPLSSWMLSLDWWLWGKAALPYHAQALLWNAAAVGLAALALRKSLPPATAGLAALFYAADPSRALPVLWISNRYALTAAAFGWLGLWAHLRGREGARWGGSVSVAAIALSLMCGESGLGGASFIVARELFDVERPLARRARALLPLAVLGLGWAILYRLGGYGALHSGAYLDPTQGLGAFLAAAPTRLLALFASLLTGMSADLWVFLPAGRGAEMGVGAAAILVVAGLLWRVGPTLAPEERHALAWLLPGATLAMVPMLATFPTDRLLTFPALGTSAGAAVLVGWGSRATADLRPAWARLAAGFQLFLQGMLHPLAWVAVFAVVHQMLGDIGRVMDSPGLRDIEGRTLILPAVSSPYASLYVTVQRWFRGETQPRVLWPLAMDPHDHRISRPDDRTLTVEVLGGEIMGSIFEDLVRSPDRPFAAGEVVPLDGATVTVDALGPGGHPRQISCRLDVSLDDPSVRILALREGQLVAVPPPPVGGAYTETWQAGPGGM